MDVCRRCGLYQPPIHSNIAAASSFRGLCQNSGLIDAEPQSVPSVHHTALTSLISSRQRDMNTSRRAANDAGVLSILK